VSTYWDVRCLDCNEESGLHLNWGADTCRGLVQFRDALAALADSVLVATDYIMITVPGEIGRVDPSFYKKHAGHVLAPVSEYGDIDGDCNELRSTGPHTTDGARCRLPEKHEGDHDFKRVTPWSPEWEAVRKAAAERRRG